MADNYLERRMEDFRSGKLFMQSGRKQRKNYNSNNHTVNNSEKNKEVRIESLSYNLSGIEAFVAIPVKENISEDEMGRIIKTLANMPVQTHSVGVEIVESSDESYEADALVTFKKDLPIGIKTADCVPMVIYCPDVKGVAAVHAGWKGTLNGIVDKTLDVLIAKGASPDRMVVFFGPSISKEVYEVDRELAVRFIVAGFPDYVIKGVEETSKPHIDLQGINKARLMNRGVLRENIILSNRCTYTAQSQDGHFLYPSYRRSGGTYERLVTIISLK